MLFQLTISGIAQGAIYALIALSLTVVYRATTIVNFGHGDFVMAGAFVVYVLVIMVGMPYIPAAILAIAILFALGIAISRGFIDPIKAACKKQLSEALRPQTSASDGEQKWCNTLLGQVA